MIRKPVIYLPALPWNLPEGLFEGVELPEFPPPPPACPPVHPAWDYWGSADLAVPVEEE